jgi:hypothetical protein
MNTLTVNFIPDPALAVRLDARQRIQVFEDILAAHPAAEFGDNPKCPLKHTFVDGIYVREIFIPAGTILTGKIHRHAHPNFLVSGTVKVFTESGGREVLKGPLWMISPAATKRVVETITDVIWITVHRVNSTNPEDAEKEIISPSYEALEENLLCHSSQ